MPAGKGETVRLDCPISERTETRSILRKDWTLAVRGNTVVDIDHHAEYRTYEPAMVERQRYVHEDAAAI